MRDLISYDAVLFAPENTGNARLRGVEFQGALKAGPWSANLTGAWLDARDRTAGSPFFENVLARRARGTGRLEVARQWSAARVAARVYAAGSRYDDLANTAPLGGYTTVDVLLEWVLAPAWTLQGKIANATDRSYQTALYYPQDGRNYFVTLRYRPPAAK